MAEMDDILDTVGNAIADGYFENVENVCGAVYIDHKGKTYVLSIMECEGNGEED